jgi:membrane protein DedA with SNARE-associated domain
MDWLPHASYVGILLALLAAGFGVPIPEDIPLLTAGYLCHLGNATLVIMLPLTLIGVLGCDVILYRMGRRLGDHVLEHRWTRRLFRRATLVTAKARFRRHGAKIIFVGRFMPGARAVIFVSAGIVGIPWWKFVAVDGVAALISVPTLVFFGWYFGEKSQAILARVRHAEYYITAGIILITVVAIATESYLGRRRKARELAAQESADGEVANVSDVSDASIAAERDATEPDVRRDDDVPASFPSGKRPPATSTE